MQGLLCKLLGRKAAFPSLALLLTSTIPGHGHFPFRVPPKYISTLTGLSLTPQADPSQHLVYMFVSVTDSAKKKFLSSFLAQKGFLNGAPSTWAGHENPDSPQGCEPHGVVTKQWSPSPLGAPPAFFDICYEIGNYSALSSSSLVS